MRRSQPPDCTVQTRFVGREPSTWASRCHAMQCRFRLTNSHILPVLATCAGLENLITTRPAHAAANLDTLPHSCEQQPAARGTVEWFSNQKGIVPPPVLALSWQEPVIPKRWQAMRLGNRYRSNKTALCLGISRNSGLPNLPLTLRSRVVCVLERPTAGTLAALPRKRREEA